MSNESLPLSHRGHVLITGASTGLGRACALHLASRGYSVIAGVRRQQDADRLCDEAAKAGCPGERFVGTIIDVVDSRSIAACVERLGDRVQGEGLKALVNNAGIGVGGPVELVRLEDWRKQFEVNVIGQVAVTQAMLPLLRRHASGPDGKPRRSARIVMMSSISGKVSQPILGPYCASKHALEAIGDALRIELKSQGIQTSLVEPGAFQSEIWGKAQTTVSEIDSAHPEFARYQGMIEVVAKGAAKVGAKAAPAIHVAKAVERCIAAKRAPARVQVGLDAKMGAFGKWCAPTVVMDFGIAKAFGV